VTVEAASRVMDVNRRQWAVRSGDWTLLIDGDATVIFNVRPMSANGTI